MKKNLFLLIIVLGALTLSCSHIDAFPPALVSYFPYSENQQIVFANERGDTTTLTVSEFFVSEGGSCPWGQKCCPPIEMRVTASNDSVQFMGYMSATYPKYLILDVKAGDVYYYEQFQGDPFSTQILSQIGDTIKMKQSENQVIVVRQKGCVQFSDSKENCIWKIIK